MIDTSWAWLPTVCRTFAHIVTGRDPIAEILLEGLDFNEDFELFQAWREEIRRRCQDIDSGNATLIDSDMVVGELRKKYS